MIKGLICLTLAFSLTMPAQATDGPSFFQRNKNACRIALLVAAGAAFLTWTLFSDTSDHVEEVGGAPPTKTIETKTETSETLNYAKQLVQKNEPISSYVDKYKDKSAEHIAKDQEALALLYVRTHFLNPEFDVEKMRQTLLTFLNSEYNGKSHSTPDFLKSEEAFFEYLSESSAQKDKAPQEASLHRLFSGYFKTYMQRTIVGDTAKDDTILKAFTYFQKLYQEQTAKQKVRR